MQKYDVLDEIITLLREDIDRFGGIEHPLNTIKRAKAIRILDSLKSPLPIMARFKIIPPFTKKQIEKTKKESARFEKSMMAKGFETAGWKRY